MPFSGDVFTFFLCLEQVQEKKEDLHLLQCGLKGAGEKAREAPVKTEGRSSWEGAQRHDQETTTEGEFRDSN